MAAVNIQDEFGKNLPFVLRWSLGSLNTYKEFIIPLNVKTINVRFETTGGYFSFSGTDGGAVSINRGVIAANTWFPIKLPEVVTTPKSIYLASTGSNVVVQIFLEG